MSEKTYRPYTGPAVLELTDVMPILADIPKGSLSALRREKDGIAEVLHELSMAVPAFGEVAGVASNYAEIVESTSRIEKLRVLRSRLAKALEVVDESEAVEEHKRETSIACIVDIVRSTARRKDASIAAPFEKTLKYHGQFADKAWKTRRRKAKEAAAQVQAEKAEQAEKAAQAGQTEKA